MCGGVRSEKCSRVTKKNGQKKTKKWTEKHTKHTHTVASVRVFYPATSVTSFHWPAGKSAVDAITTKTTHARARYIKKKKKTGTVASSWSGTQSLICISAEKPCSGRCPRQRHSRYLNILGGGSVRSGLSPLVKNGITAPKKTVVKTITPKEVVTISPR